VDRIQRNINNRKQDKISLVSSQPSIRAMRDGEESLYLGRDGILMRYRREKGVLWKTQMSKDGNQYVEKDIKIKNNLVVGGTADIGGNVQVDGSVTIGIDDTGYDVKFFGATASAYSLWDASEDRYTLANPTGAPTLRLLRNDSSITTNDSLGKIEFAGLDDEEDVGCMIEGQARGGWNGGSDIPAAMIFWIADDGTTTLREHVRYQWNSNTFNEQGYSDVDFRVESDNQTHMFFVDAGQDNIGIGTSSPDSGADVHIYGGTNGWLYIDGAQDSGLKILDGGTMRWEIFNSTGSSDRLYIRDEESDTGVYIAQDATDWTSLSDISLKTDITSISNALSKVNSIRGVNFKWKKYKPDGSKPIPSRDRNRIGCIAQEVNEVLPEAVDTSKDGEWGVSYSTLIPLLVEAVKELSAEVDILKNQ
jgi:hypothetical protein